MDWEALLAKRVKPPFLPSIKAPADVSNFDEEFTRLKPVLTPPQTPFFLTAEQQEFFADFDFSALHWLPLDYTQKGLWHIKSLLSFLCVLFIQFSPSHPPLSSAVESNETGPVSPFKSCCSLFVKLAANMRLNSKDSPDWTLKSRGNHVITPDQNFAATTVS